MELTPLGDLSALAGDDYITYFMAHPLSELWSLFLLSLGRIIAIVSITPFLGGRVLSAPMKILFGATIAIILFPFIVLKTTAHIALDVQFALLLFKEILIGFMMGFLISLPFFYAQSAGSLIDHQRGAQSLQVTDPTTQGQSSPLGLFYGNMMLVIFFYVGGPFLFFNALFTSYDLLPMDHFLSEVFFTSQNPLWFELVTFLHQLLKMSLQLSAPALITILMTDLFLGIANRMAPQVQISFLLMSLKAFIGLAILWVAWGLIIKQMDIQSLSYFTHIKKLVTQF